jgi:O-antigen ligase
MAKVETSELRIRFQRHDSTAQAWREGTFRKAAFLFLWMLIFVIPWENGVVISGFGTFSRAVGIPAFGMALLAILERGTLRPLTLQQAIILFFLVWGGLTYFWSSAPSDTVTSTFTFVQLLTMVWLIWEFAQTRKEQLLLLRAYSLGSVVSSVAALIGFLQETGQHGFYSGLNFYPGDLGFILALAIPISLYLAVQERRKILVWVYGAATVLAFCAIVLTASRASLLACIPTLLMLPFLFPNLRWGRNLFVLVFFALGAIASWLYMPEGSWLRLSTMGSEIASITSNRSRERTMSWQTGWQVFGKAPFQGVGTGAYAAAVKHTPGIPSHTVGTDSADQVSPPVAHNTFFSVLVQQGLIGLGLFFMLLLALALSAWKLPKVERIFWLCILLTWTIGASALTWEQGKPTWFVFGLLIAVAATKFAPRTRLYWKYAAGGVPADLSENALLSAQISGFQGLSS